MKKFRFLYLVFLLFPYFSFGQDIPILFDTNMETYEVIDNPTSLNGGEVWQRDSKYPIYFDFDFEIYGTVYNSVLVDAGLGLTFSGFNARKVWVWGSEWGGGGQLLDQGTDESLSPIDYEIVGDIGSRILKIQWTNAGIKGGDVDDPDDFVDFQMWVCEGTDRIEVHYGTSQTSEYSFGYNDGPGVRFFNIEDNWGICVWGYPDMPSWDWVLFEGPVGGCLLDGVPSQNMVFNFFPNPTVSIDENMETDLLDFDIINNKQNELKLNITEFEYSKKYELEVFNMQGIKVLDLIIDNKYTYLDQKLFSQGLYIFTLKQDQNSKVQKLMLH